MQMKWPWLTWMAAILAMPMHGGPDSSLTSPRQPVLVELFTSEGCSSCPPADALLSDLDRQQPVDGAQIIILSEHVDYWNHLGWKDPFSSPDLTARQVNYDRRFGLDGPYTPQMVVDGQAEVNGADRRKAFAAIQQAAGQAKVGVRIHPATLPGAVTIEVDPLPDGEVHKAGVYLARAADSGSSDVLKGENQGRTLHYVSIVEDIRQVGTAGRQAMFSSQVPVYGAHGNSRVRLIAFVQDSGGRVWGSAMYATPK